MTRLPPLLWSLIVGLAFLPVASAEPSATAQEEITYLLGFVGNSGCEFYRNGNWHDARSAQAHLRGKYAYLAERGRIQTAGDFIEKAATRSSLTGRAYQVRCSGGALVTSNQWLRDELARYRNCSTVGARCASHVTRDAPGLDVTSSGAKFSRPP